MTGLVRRTPDAAVRVLASRLAEDYATVPLVEVSRIVQDAADTATGDGEWAGTPSGIPAILDVIEQLAREDLDARVATVRTKPAVSARRAGAAPPARRRRAPRRAAG